MSREATCKERAREHYRGRLDDLRKLWKGMLDGAEDVPDLGSLNEYGLCFDYVAPRTFNGQVRGYFRYQLSWGGPSDEFRFYCDETRRPYKVEYWFLDWNDGAKITAQGHNFELLREIFDWSMEGRHVEAMIDAGRG